MITAEDLMQEHLKIIEIDDFSVIVDRNII